MIELINSDCLTFLEGTPTNHYDLAIVDPPYGININMNMGRKRNKRKRFTDKDWDNTAPTEEYFTELFRVSRNQIIWGGNYFALPPTFHFIFWDKLTPSGMSFSDGEYAWTSFNKANRKFTFRNVTNDKIHPTQKPVKLYEWLINNYTIEGQKILDTHLGSGSSAIAAHNYNRDFTGIEIDEKYFDAASRRLFDHKNQLNIWR